MKFSFCLKSLKIKHQLLLAIILAFLCTHALANTVILSARVKAISNENIYAEASRNGEFMDVDPFILEGEAWLMIQAIFEGNEESHVLQIRINPEFATAVKLEQRTLTRAWLYEEGKTKPTSVFQVSKWKPMKELGTGQYQLGKLDIQYPKNTLEKIIEIEDDELDEYWKNLARQCIKEKSSDCEALDYVEEIEIRVLIEENKKFTEVEKIRLDRPYGC